MIEYPKADIAVNNLLANRLFWGEKAGIGVTDHNPPSPHYPHIYFWDEIAATITYARHGGQNWQRAGMLGLNSLVKGQREDGFISNIQFFEIGRKLDPERPLFGKDAKGSNYTQPPILATGIKEIFESVCERDQGEALAFLYDIYPKADKFYKYIEANRSNSEEDKLMGIIHPHETGRDSDPTFDFIKPLRLKRNGVDTPIIKDLANTPIDYLSILAHGARLKKAQGDIKKEREIFWVNDVMMNCTYAHNLYEMSELAGHMYLVEDQIKYKKRAQKVEQAILDKMWFPDARAEKGIFYALNKDGRPIEEVSISNLFPLLLPNLSEQQLESILDLMDESFNTDFPLPSVATDSPNYDPHNREKDRLWRGSKWMIVDFLIAEYGLKQQIKREDLNNRPDLLSRCTNWANRIIESSEAVLDKHGPWEHYNPENSKPQRKRVKNFGWSNLGYVMLQNA